jgi:Fe-S-cluster containining protein
MSQLWQECLTCKTTCCNHEVASQLFVTPNELKCIGDTCPDDMKSFSKGSIPCPFLTEDHLCRIHTIKPVDCRLFPFDLVMNGDKFFWIIREIDCKIIEDEDNLEEYLKDFEENIISDFKPYMKDYSLFRFGELAEKFGFRVLREVKFKESL